MVQRALDEGRPKAAGPSSPGDEGQNREGPRLQEGEEGSKRKQVQMIVNGAPPSRAEKPRLKTVGVGGSKREQSPDRQDARGLVQEGRRIAQVLDEVGRVHQIEGGHGEGGRFQGPRANGQAEAGFSIARLGRRDLHSLWFPTQTAQGVKQGARGATGIQDAGLSPLLARAGEKRLRRRRQA